MAEGAKKCAVVTGSNKGIGFEICRQLASKGIAVILTARDEKRGLEALEKLKTESGLSDEDLVFHRLDVADPAAISLLADFVKTRFGKLDILVNNAAVSGIISDAESLKTAFSKQNVDYSEIIEETYELAKECLEINYYGTKRMCEALFPLLMASDSPRIVNVSSTMGKLQNIPNEWAKNIFIDTDNMTEERIDEVIDQFLKDFKEGSVQTKGWPKYMSAYTVSKAAINAYTRILARERPSKVLVNSVCPGFVKTDINYKTGFLSVEEGAESPVRLALLPQDGPSGCFFDRKQVSDP